MSHTRYEHRPDKTLAEPEEYLGMNAFQYAQDDVNDHVDFLFGM